MLCVLCWTPHAPITIHLFEIRASISIALGPPSIGKVFLFILFVIHYHGMIFNYIDFDLVGAVSVFRHFGNVTQNELFRIRFGPEETFSFINFIFIHISTFIDQYISIINTYNINILPFCYFIFTVFYLQKLIVRSNCWKTIIHVYQRHRIVPCESLSSASFESSNRDYSRLYSVSMLLTTK